MKKALKESWVRGGLEPLFSLLLTQAWSADAVGSTAHLLGGGVSDSEGDGRFAGSTRGYGRRKRG